MTMTVLLTVKPMTMKTAVVFEIIARRSPRRLPPPVIALGPGGPPPDHRGEDSDRGRGGAKTGSAYVYTYVHVYIYILT